VNREEISTREGIRVESGIKKERRKKEEEEEGRDYIEKIDSKPQ
jgi:hypothetical protein